jgi:hypothetical protein
VPLLFWVPLIDQPRIPLHPYATCLKLVKRPLSTESIILSHIGGFYPFNCLRAAGLSLKPPDFGVPDIRNFGGSCEDLERYIYLLYYVLIPSIMQPESDFGPPTESISH